MKKRCDHCVHYLRENKGCCPIIYGKRHFKNVEPDNWCEHGSFTVLPGEQPYKSYNDLKKACDGAIGTGFEKKL